VGRTKLSKKTKIGDGSGMVPGVPNKFQSNPVCSFPEQNFQKFVFFQRLSTSRLFYRYLAVKSYLRVLKFFVEFINVSKTGFKSKIRAPWADILAFFRGKVRRDSISITIENFKTRIYWKFGFFWKAYIATFQKSNIRPNKLLETSELFEKIHFYS
jgi:hypothetical protein